MLLSELSTQLNINKPTLRRRLKRLQESNPKTKLYDTTDGAIQLNDRGVDLLKKDVANNPVKITKSNASQANVKELLSRISNLEDFIEELKFENRELREENKRLSKQNTDLIEKLLETLN